MARTCPPRALTVEEWKKNGGHDPAFEHWFKYKSGLLVAVYYWFVEKVLRKKKDIFPDKTN